MSAEADRARAISQGVYVMRAANNRGDGVAALLDAGWVPPAQRNEELRQTAAWQRDARTSFEAIDALAHQLVEAGEPAAPTGELLLELLGERFRTPEATQ